MAAFVIDRESPTINSEWCFFYGEGFQTRSPRFDIRSPALIGTSNQNKIDLIDAYYSARNISTGYVDPPALPSDASFSGTYSKSVAAGSTMTVFSDAVCRLRFGDMPDAGPLTRVIYPYNTATADQGPGYVAMRPKFFWADTDLYPTKMQTWVQKQLIQIYGRNLCPNENSGRVAGIFARDTTSGQIYEVKRQEHNFPTSADEGGSWGGVRTVSVFFYLETIAGAALPAGTYEFFLSHNSTVYGICSLGVRTVAAPSAETIQTLDCRGTFTCGYQSPTTNYQLSPIQTSDQNSLAIAAAMMEAYRLYVANGQRVRVILPAGRFKICRRMCVPWGVIADLSQGCILEVDESTTFTTLALQSGDTGGSNSLYSVCPTALRYAFRSSGGAASSDAGRSMVWLLESGTDDVMGGVFIGGEVVTCRSIFPQNGNYPQHAFGFYIPDSTRGGASGINNNLIKDTTIRNAALVPRSGVDSLTAIFLSSAGAGTNATRTDAGLIRRVLIDGVKIFAKSAIGGPPQCRIKYIVVDNTEITGPYAGSYCGEFGRILQNHCLIRRTRWQRLNRGPLGRPDGGPMWRTLVYDCAAADNGYNADGSEQILWECMGAYESPAPVTFALGGDPLKMRIQFVPTDWDHEIDKTVFIAGGPGQGQIRRITAFTRSAAGAGVPSENSSRENGAMYDITIDRAWTGTVNSSSRVVVETIPHECAVSVYRQNRGFKGLVLYGSCVDFVMSMGQFYNVDMAVNIVSRTRANKSNILLDGISTPVKGIVPQYEVRLIKHEFVDCSCGVWLCVAYERTETVPTMVNFCDYYSYFVNSCCIFKADFATWSTTGTGMWGATFFRSNFDSAMFGAYRGDGLTNSDKGYPVRRLVSTYPLSFQASSNSQTPWYGLSLLNATLNGHDMPDNYDANKVWVEDFVGPLDGGSGQPTGFVLPGSLPTDVQIDVDSLVSVDQFNARLTTAESGVSSLRSDVGTTPISPSVKSQLSSLDNAVASLDASDTSQNATLASHGSRLTAAEGTISSHTSTISSHGTRLDTAEGTISSHTSTLSSHTSTLSSHGTRLDAVEGTVGTHTTQIASANTAISLLDGRVTAVEGLVDDYDALPGRMDDVEGQVTALASQVAANNAGVSGVQDDITTVNIAISGLQTQITTQGGQISSATTSAASAHTRLNALEPRVTVAESGITTLGQTVDTMDAALGNVEARIGQAEINITEIFTNCCQELSGGGFQLFPNVVVLQNISGEGLFFGFLPPRGRYLPSGEVFTYTGDFWAQLTDMGPTYVTAFRTALETGKIAILQTTTPPPGVVPSDLLPPE